MPFFSNTFLLASSFTVGINTWRLSNSFVQGVAQANLITGSWFQNLQSQSSCLMSWFSTTVEQNWFPNLHAQTFNVIYGKRLDRKDRKSGEGV